MKRLYWMEDGALAAWLVMVAPPIVAKAPELARTWAKTYGGAQSDMGSFLMKENGDGTYLVSGLAKSTGGNGQDALLMKVDGAGSVIWQKAYGSAGDDYGYIYTTHDGGFAIVFSGGPTAPLTLMKLDGSGEISWQKSYGVAGDTFSSAQVLTDGGFFLSGSTFKYPSTSIQLMKLDVAGNVLWQSKCSISSLRLTGLAAIPQGDGSYLAGAMGIDLEGVPNAHVIIKCESNGAIAWVKSFAVTSGQVLGVVVPCADGGSIYAGSHNPDPHPGTGADDILLAKFDASGDITWQKTYGGPESDQGSILLIDGGYILSGSSGSYSAAGNQNAILAKLDTGGDVVWAKSYGGTQDDRLNARPDSAGGYILQGTTLSYGSERSTKTDFWAVKVDDSGDILWQRSYGGVDYDSGLLHRTGDGGLILTGSTKSSGAGDYDLWIWKLDSQGQVGAPCPLLDDTSTVAEPIELDNWAGTLEECAYSFSVSTPAYTSGTGSMAKHNIALSEQDACIGASLLSANASANVTSGDAPLAVNFSGTASDGTGIYSYLWDFGDGITSPLQSPSHNYASAGNFAVTFTVTDSAQSVATDNHLVITVTAGACTVGCAAIVPIEGTVGQALSFTSTYTTSAGCVGAPAFLWTFGDESAPSAMQNSSHTYSSPGTYTWSFTASMGDQICNQRGKVIINQIACSVECSAIVPSVGTAGMSIPFAGIATPSNCTSAMQYQWTFGDQSTPSSDQSPSHIYTLAGIYNWALTVTADGQTCSTNGTISIMNGSGTPGDCDGDGSVSIGEVQKAINMFLGAQAVGCGVDCSGDGAVSIGEIQKVINSFLGLGGSC